MELQLKYKGHDYETIMGMVIKAHDDVSLRFKEKLENLIVCVHKGRKEFDKKLNRKTEPWFVANAANGEINILHGNSFAKESTHKADEFFPILKHEVAHLFIDKITNGKSVPKWLDEGLASYVSEKYKDISLVYIEEDFCEKLGTPKGWDEHSEYCAYDTASLFVTFLAEKYTLDKIMELLSKLDRNYYYPEFETAFKNSFGKTLKDLEKDFVGKISKPKEFELGDTPLESASSPAKIKVGLKEKNEREASVFETAGVEKKPPAEDNVEEKIGMTNLYRLASRTVGKEEEKEGLIGIGD